VHGKMKYVAQLFLYAVPDLNSKLLPQESKAFPLRLEELDPYPDAEKFGLASGRRFSASS
jgi:hypothetical protein